MIEELFNPAAEGCCFTMAGLPPGFAVTLADVWQHVLPWLHPGSGPCASPTSICIWTLWHLNPRADPFRLWKLRADVFAELRVLSRTGTWISVYWYFEYRDHCNDLRQWRREEEALDDLQKGTYR